MRFARQSVAWCGALSVVLWLSACGSMDRSTHASVANVPPAGTVGSRPAVVGSEPKPHGTSVVPSTMHAYRMQAAQKIMRANAERTFDGVLPERLLSIPVLSVHLRADGTVSSVEVLRTPQFAPESIGLAKAAVMRAAPFGSVAHLPKPWQFNETFLFNDDLKFQLHSLQP